LSGENIQKYKEILISLISTIILITPFLNLRIIRKNKQMVMYVCEKCNVAYEKEIRASSCCFTTKIKPKKDFLDERPEYVTGGW
jgi:hypothetical protein